jgi:nitrite reductase/ring-hydroxylating ferredoxin subunit
MAEEQRLSGQNVICPSAALQEGGKGVRFRVLWHGVNSPAFVIRYQGVAHAYLNQCGHVPVELDWQEGEFFDVSGVYLICATHGAEYSPKTGHCMTGRCNGKGLTGLPVEETNGQILLLEHQLINP